MSEVAAAMVTAAMTVAEARRALAASLRAAGLETPELDARLLLGHALSLDHAALVAASARPLTATESAQVAALAARRRAGEPVARIVGRREFWGLRLAVTPAVLVPRPETETVVELALSLIGDRGQALRLADLGTGSGAILLALLSELPQASGVGTDLSAEALAVARANARNLRLEGRASFVESDYGGALAGPFDLVVSNPPYVASRDIATLDIEVRAHDPALALDGGADGLNAYRRIAADAARLIGGGHLVVEIGAGQEREVENLFVARGLAVTAFRHDLSGRARALAARVRLQK
ncbi:MAG TPA: peptide chain release factor N(5)-glutamine methyltransferase [Xanthobacteraceae bacterium]|nr:peptide chain release factor N(5)-glutamine methyltransferase [Xanthobacteraceae bacterium]